MIVKNHGHDVPARSARTPVLSAMSALNASARRGHGGMRGFAYGVLESKRTILPSILLSSFWWRLVGRPPKPPDFKPAVQVVTSTASLKTTKLVPFPHVPQGAVQPACRGPAGEHLVTEFGTVEPGL